MSLTPSPLCSGSRRRLVHQGVRSAACPVRPSPKERPRRPLAKIRERRRSGQSRARLEGSNKRPVGRPLCFSTRFPLDLCTPSFVLASTSPPRFAVGLAEVLIPSLGFGLSQRSRSGRHRAAQLGSAGYGSCLFSCVCSRDGLWNVNAVRGLHPLAHFIVGRIITGVRVRVALS